MSLDHTERPVSRSFKFAIQLAVTTAGALLDYFVGRLTNKMSLGILAWAVLTLIAAAALDFARDVWREHRTAGYGYGRSTPGGGLAKAAGVVRGRIRTFRWTTVVNAMLVAGLAAVASYAFTLAVLTVRFLAVTGSSELGQQSPYNDSAIAFIGNFQASSTAAWLVVACFVLALLLRPPVVLPLGVVAVSLINAAIVAMPSLTRNVILLRSQLATSLSIPDTWLMGLPADLVLFGCLAPFGLGVLTCGLINRTLS